MWSRFYVSTKTAGGVPALEDLLNMIMMSCTRKIPKGGLEEVPGEFLSASLVVEGDVVRVVDRAEQ